MTDDGERLEPDVVSGVLHYVVKGGSFIDTCLVGMVP